jgi:hypothetical protein
VHRQRGPARDHQRQRPAAQASELGTSLHDDAGGEHHSREPVAPERDRQRWDDHHRHQRTRKRDRDNADGQQQQGAHTGYCAGRLSGRLKP